MILKIYIPPDKDLPFDSIRLAYTITPQNKIVTAPPFGKPVIILFINPNSVKNYGVYSEGVLLGQHTQPLMLELNDNYRVMAIHLKPFALKQLFNVDASALTNKYISINNYSLTTELYRLVVKYIDSDKQLIPELLQFFDSAKRYPVSYEVSEFLNYLQSNAPSPVSKICKAIGVSERNLERKFKTEVGLTPKKYIQVKRIFQIFETLNESTDWQQVVADHNYTDQAHLINEFKKYTHIAPGLFVRKGLTVAAQLPPFSNFEL